MKRVSIHDVAARAGTSPATVSKVLTAMPGSGIPEVTAERVRRVVRELGYAPWSPARSLRRRRTETIGIITYDLSLFFADVVKGVEAAALEHGLTTVLATHGDDGALEARHLQLALRGQVDGLVVVPARSNRNQRVYDDLKARGVPFVFVDRYIPDYEGDYVGTENETAAYRLTRALIVQGASVVGCVAGRGGNTALVERVAGYRRAVAETGLPHDDDLCVTSPGSQVETVGRLLDRRPRVNGVFWASYAYMQPSLSALAARGIQVPRDVRFAGFDTVNLSLSCLEDYEALRVIGAPWPAAIQPGQELGRRALALLAQALAREGEAAPQQIRLEPHYEWLPSGLEGDDR
ncbi:MAG: LacI family DNA-binding transcriptional regulator [Chloroflexi bacterium]|nr:LacI family DNA-binding transcriptional regulator [Chloroflexota bacterium]